MRILPFAPPRAVTRFAVLGRDRFNKQYDSFHNISAYRFGLASSPNRQRKKGPIVRRGRVYS